MTAEETAALRVELERAQSLQSREAPGGPAWAAIAAWIEELESLVGGQRPRPPTDETPPAAA